MSITLRIPALHDRHSHASLYAALGGCLSLAGLGSAAVLDALRALPPDTVSVALGWHSGLAPLEPADLAAMPPVVIVNVSLHGFRLSPRATALLAETEPDLVRHQDDAEWIERHLPAILEFLTRIAGLTAGKLESFMGGVRPLGLAVVDDMLVPDDHTMAVLQHSRWGGRMSCWATPQACRRMSPASQQALAGLKLFTDGAIGTRTAALRGTYRDGTSGMLVYADADLHRVLGECADVGKAVAIHAIGDRATDQVIATIERLARDGVSWPAVRLEHVQFIDRTQARRARDLGLVLSMQPNFNSDSSDYADRLDGMYLAANNPFRLLIDDIGFVPGRDMVFGSDGMPHGVEYAWQWSLFPPFPGQQLTVDELVAGYGIEAGDGGESLVEIDDAQRRVRMLDSAG